MPSQYDFHWRLFPPFCFSCCLFSWMYVESRLCPIRSSISAQHWQAFLASFCGRCDYWTVFPILLCWLVHQGLLSPSPKSNYRPSPGCNPTALGLHIYCQANRGRRKRFFFWSCRRTKRKIPKCRERSLLQPALAPSALYYGLSCLLWRMLKGNYFCLHLLLKIMWVNYMPCHKQDLSFNFRLLNFWDKNQSLGY